MAMPSVVRATEGAAPKRPAKLLGRHTSATAANKETITPPSKNLAVKSPTVEDNIAPPEIKRLAALSESVASPHRRLCSPAACTPCLPAGGSSRKTLRVREETARADPA